MPPTVGDSDRERRKEKQDRKEGFVCIVKYTNFLPDIPFDAKFVGFPFETNRFIQYKPTSLERNYKNDLLTEPDLGVTIDLINPETYDIDPLAELHEDDERLLEEEQAPQADQKRQRQHAKTVSWLRKTEYISTEYNRFQTSNEMVETKVGHGTKKQLRGIENLDLYKDRDSQLQAIESSFEAAKKPITRHHTNSRLHPVEILPVFPDFHFWHMPCAHVIFDTEPTPRGKTSSATKEEMSLGMIRGMEDESGDQFVAYFLPSSETLQKRRQQASQPDNEQPENSDQFDYKLAREYNWNVQNKAIKGFEENYFFVLREGEGVFYNELQTRVRLNKRRGVGGTGKISSSVSKLIVKTREPTENEIRLQTMRLMQLENVAQEDDDEEEDEDEAEASGGEQPSEKEDNVDVEDDSGGEQKPTAEESDNNNKSSDEEEERAEESPQAEEEEAGEEQNEEEENKQDEQSNHSESDIFGSSSSEEDD